MSRTVVLVEGESDRAALLAVAAGSFYDSERFSVTAMGGITNVDRFVVAAASTEARVAGLYDAGAEHHVARALNTAGMSQDGSVAGLEGFGFFRCDPDLEAELIAALGAERVVDIVSAQGRDLQRFQKMQQMPEWRGRPIEDQLRRWFGSGARRKARYAALLAGAMSPDMVPEPIRRVLTFASNDS